MTFINTAHKDTQQSTQEKTQDTVQQLAYEEAQKHTQEDTQFLLSNVRTQGRKGHKKPRINLAFDSDEFLDKIRARADKDGMSITQLVNEAVAYYLQHTKAKKRGR